jgi:molecular chaperone DnaK
VEIDKPVGIDLGTTNSCVGVMNETESDVILATDRLGVSTTPSCVWFDEKRNELVVGKDAFTRRGSERPPVVSIKRKMGTMLLTPLGFARRPPLNLPPALARVLSETREQRLERYLARIEDSDPRQRAAKLAQARAKPPELWVFDQAARLEAYLSGFPDAAERERQRRDPPLLWLPEEISALILAEERRQIAATQSQQHPPAIGGSAARYRVERAVITVPAYFGARQVEATREAGALAGLQVLELLQEPTAAARYYCWKHNLQDGVFLVFDLGGGTFDVSVVRRTAGVFDTLGTSGHNFLGGDDLDRRLSEWIRQRVASESPQYDLNLDARGELDSRGDRDANIRDRFVHLAEGVKKSLTISDATLLRDTNTVKDRRGNAVAIEMRIGREDFDELAAATLAQCEPKCWEALAKAKQKANVSLQDVDYVFLVGGSTHAPCVERLVKERFCRHSNARPLGEREAAAALLAEIQGDDERQTGELRGLAREMMTAGERARCPQPLKDNPDLCVALGAAIAAAAYGVAARSDSNGATIEFAGPRGTCDREITIKGRVAAAESAKLAGAVVRLTSDPPGIALETPLADGAFLFRRVGLVERSHNRFQVTVASPAGAVLAQAPLVIEQNPHYSEVSSGLDGSAAVSRAIYIDVARQGKVTKMPLVESGAVLTGGLERRRRLKVPEPNAGMLRFRLYQGRRPLADIVDVIDPTIAPGTPITFTLSISEDQLMRGRYLLGDDPAPRSFVIEPPPPESAPTPRQIREKNQQIEDALSYKPPVQAQTFRLRAGKINRQLEQTRADGDEPKLIDAFGELDDLLREIGQTHSPLSPAWGEYEGLLEACRRLVDDIETRKPGYPAAEARKTLDAEAADALAAYNAPDQQLYTERWERLRELRRGLEGELSSEPRLLKSSPAEQARKRIDVVLQQAAELERAAGNFASQFARRSERPPAGDTPERNRAHASQCRQCGQELAGCQTPLQKLKSTCATAPDEALAECLSYEAMVERWRIVLLAKQEILTGRKVANLESIPESDETHV